MPNTGLSKYLQPSGGLQASGRIVLTTDYWSPQSVTCCKVLARKCLSGNWNTSPVLDSLSVGEVMLCLAPSPAGSRT